MPEDNPEELDKVTRFAVKAAKDSIFLWAERFEDDDLRMQVLLAASLAVASNAIEAVIAIEDDEVSDAVMDAIERGLLKHVEQLRKVVETAALRKAKPDTKQ